MTGTLSPPTAGRVCETRDLYMAARALAEVAGLTFCPTLRNFVKQGKSSDLR